MCQRGKVSGPACTGRSSASGTGAITRSIACHAASRRARCERSSASPRARSVGSAGYGDASPTTLRDSAVSANERLVTSQRSAGSGPAQPAITTAATTIRIDS